MQSFVSDKSFPRLQTPSLQGKFALPRESFLSPRKVCPFFKWKCFLLERKLWPCAKVRRRSPHTHKSPQYTALLCNSNYCNILHCCNSTVAIYLLLAVCHPQFRLLVPSHCSGQKAPRQPVLWARSQDFRRGKLQNLLFPTTTISNLLSSPPTFSRPLFSRLFSPLCVPPLHTLHDPKTSVSEKCKTNLSLSS